MTGRQSRAINYGLFHRRGASSLYQYGCVHECHACAVYLHVSLSLCAHARVRVWTLTLRGTWCECVAGADFYPTFSATCILAHVRRRRRLSCSGRETDVGCFLIPNLNARKHERTEHTRSTRNGAIMRKLISHLGSFLCAVCSSIYHTCIILRRLYI